MLSKCPLDLRCTSHSCRSIVNVRAYTCVYENYTSGHISQYCINSPKMLLYFLSESEVKVSSNLFYMITFTSEKL